MYTLVEGGNDTKTSDNLVRFKDDWFMPTFDTDHPQALVFQTAIRPLVNEQLQRLGHDYDAQNDANFAKQVSNP